MRSNVILRGESREGTILESTMTYEGEDEGDRIETIIMNNVTQAGLEDFTICYKVTYEGEIMHPLDYDWKFEDFYPYEKRSQNFENRRVYHDRANFIYHTRNDLGVTFLRITGSSTKNVITSYSIHYTKLYERILLTVFARSFLSTGFKMIPTIPVA